MLLDRINKKRDAIKTIGVEAAERAAALGIETVTVVHPQPKQQPMFGRMINIPERVAKSVTVRLNERNSQKPSVIFDKKR